MVTAVCRRLCLTRRNASPRCAEQCEPSASEGGGGSGGRGGAMAFRRRVRQKTAKCRPSGISASRGVYRRTGICRVRREAATEVSVEPHSCRRRASSLSCAAVSPPPRSSVSWRSKHRRHSAALLQPQALAVRQGTRRARSGRQHVRARTSESTGLSRRAPTFRLVFLF